MIKVNITNAICQLKNQTSQNDLDLFELLAYKDQSVEYSVYEKTKKINKLNFMINHKSFQANKQVYETEIARLKRELYFISKNLYIRLYKEGEFATGLLPRVIEYFQNNNIAYELNDLRIKPKKKHTFILKESLPPLRYYQKKAVKALKEQSRGIVVCPTGAGKTKIIIKMIWELGVNTLIITPSKSITSMMYDELVSYFGKGKVEKLNTKSKKLKPINLVNIQALIKIDPKVFKDLDAVFTDEFHHSGASTYFEANLNHLKNAYFRVGVTATNFRTDGSDLSLEAVLSNVLYTYEINQALADGFLTRPEFRFIENKVNQQTRWQAAYKKEIVENYNRNLKIAEVAKKHSSEQTIILVQQIEHGEALLKLLPNAHFLKGDVKDHNRDAIMEDFRKKKIKLLIGSSVIGEGVDLPCAEVLILAGGGKSKIQVMQNVGRVLRVVPGKERAIIYDFKDQGCRWLEEHSNQRSEVYKQYK